MNKLLLSIFLLVQLAGCKVKDPFPKSPPPANPLDQLPPATQTGQYTFGCLVDGRAWLPAGSPLNGPLVTASYASRNLVVVANGASKVNGVVSGGIMHIEINAISIPGRYILAKKDTSFVRYDTGQCVFTTDALHPATVEITRLDLVARIVSGRFAFTLDTPGCGQVIVSDGRFDARF